MPFVIRRTLYHLERNYDEPFGNADTAGFFKGTPLYPWPTVDNFTNYSLIVSDTKTAIDVINPFYVLMTGASASKEHRKNLKRLIECKLSPKHMQRFWSSCRRPLHITEDIYATGKLRHYTAWDHETLTNYDKTLKYNQSCIKAIWSIKDYLNHVRVDFSIDYMPDFSHLPLYQSYSYCDNNNNPGHFTMVLQKCIQLTQGIFILYHAHERFKLPSTFCLGLVQDHPCPTRFDTIPDDHTVISYDDDTLLTKFYMIPNDHILIPYDDFCVVPKIKQFFDATIKNENAVNEAAAKLLVTKPQIKGFFLTRDDLNCDDKICFANVVMYTFHHQIPEIMEEYNTVKQLHKLKWSMFTQSNESLHLPEVLVNLIHEFYH
jgi:hypothetical protein